MAMKDAPNAARAARIEDHPSSQQHRASRRGFNAPYTPAWSEKYTDARKICGIDCTHLSPACFGVCMSAGRMGRATVFFPMRSTMPIVVDRDTHLSPFSLSRFRLVDGASAFQRVDRSGALWGCGALAPADCEGVPVVGRGDMRACSGPCTWRAWPEGDTPRHGEADPPELRFVPHREADHQKEMIDALWFLLCDSWLMTNGLWPRK